MPPFAPDSSGAAWLSSVSGMMSSSKPGGRTAIIHPPSLHPPRVNSVLDALPQLLPPPPSPLLSLPPPPRDLPLLPPKGGVGPTGARWN
eukprot:2700559-Pyramimonas_sp.AAC.1